MRRSVNFTAAALWRTQIGPSGLPLSRLIPFYFPYAALKKQAKSFSLFLY